MEPKYRYSESTVEPVAIEMTIDNTVYLRKDITSEVRTDEQGNKTVYWLYKEAMLTAEEFNEYAGQVMSLNAVKDVDNAKNIRQLVAKQENGDFNQIAIMEAIAEIYEMVAMTE
mgnify:CR=1 FL=1